MNVIIIPENTRHTYSLITKVIIYRTRQAKKKKKSYHFPENAMRFEKKKKITFVSLSRIGCFFFFSPLEPQHRRKSLLPSCREFKLVRVPTMINFMEMSGIKSTWAGAPRGHTDVHLRFFLAPDTHGSSPQFPTYVVSPSQNQIKRGGLLWPQSPIAGKIALQSHNFFWCHFSIVRKGGRQFFEQQH